MDFNRGKFEGNVYRKKVNFSKAVLWKDRQISLRVDITSQFKSRGVDTVIFEDERKNERWTASVEKLREVKVLKAEGQEQQLYFPIEAFKVSAIHKVRVPIEVAIKKEEEHQDKLPL